MAISGTEVKFMIIITIWVAAFQTLNGYWLVVEIKLENRIKINKMKQSTQNAIVMHTGL